MKASVITGIRGSQVLEAPEPEISSSRQIKIRVLVCGLCNSEAERWLGAAGSIGQVIGHEPVGIVVEKGAEVTEFEIGDRVAAGFCHHAFAEYTVQDASLFAKVPEGLTDEEAIGEPPSCMLGVVNRLPVKAGDKAAVIGCGYMGLLLLSFLKLKGCANITAVDMRRDSLERALLYGADEVFTPEELKPEHFVDGFDERTLIDGFDQVFEVTGGEPGLKLASRMVKGHGYLGIVGFHTSPRTVDMRLWNVKGLNVVNCHDKRMDMRGKYIRDLMTMMGAGKFTQKSLITHGFTLDEVDKGFQAMLGHEGGYIKGYVRIGSADGRESDEHLSVH